MVWEKSTGKPVHDAIVWQDTRTDKLCGELRGRGARIGSGAETGLPIATYFSGPKARWILDNVDGTRERAKLASCCSATSTPGASGT